MNTRPVEIGENAARILEEVGQELLRAGDVRATTLLALNLAWRYSRPSIFRCMPDESAGLAELPPPRVFPSDRSDGSSNVHELHSWSKRV